MSSKKYYLTFVTMAILAAVISAVHPKTNKKIVIVGAGAAGIAAAKLLLIDGLESITILEAQDYYGGRIRTVLDDGNEMIEYGAQGLEGTVGNSAYSFLVTAGLAPEPNELFKEKSLVESVESDSNIYVQSNGDDFPIQEMKPFLESITATLDEVYNSSESLSAFYNKKFHELSDDKGKVDLALSFAQIYAETHSPASNWDQTNGIGFGGRMKLEGGYFRPQGGMKTVMDVMMDVEDGILSEKWKNILKLNSEVTHIDWSVPQPVVTYVDRVTKETHTIVADYVIVTVSLGVLKESHHKLFQPQLPQTMTDAIDTLNFGLENQIYLKFSERWWPEGKDLHIIWRPEDKSSLELQDEWLPKIEVISPRNEKTLMIYVMESEQYHTDDLSEEELIAKIMPVLRKAFGHKGWKITDPVKVYHSKWYANQFVRGALPYPTIASYQKGVKFSDLAPMLNGPGGTQTLFFAGDATIDLLYSSVHGAVDSGIIAASNILYG